MARHIHQVEIENTAVYEDTYSDTSSIRSGVSLGNVTVGSFQSDIEEELQDLSAQQLKDLLLQLNPLNMSTCSFDPIQQGTNIPYIQTTRCSNQSTASDHRRRYRTFNITC